MPGLLVGSMINVHLPSKYREADCVSALADVSLRTPTWWDKTSIEQHDHSSGSLAVSIDRRRVELMT